MNIFKTLFLGTCLLTACSQSNQLNDCTSIKINNTQYEKWSSFFNIEEIVPLEQTDKSLVTMASKCSVNDGMVFFSDFRLKSLFVFGLDGKFKFEVGKSGKAANEHIVLEDFYYNGKKKTVTILDERGLAVYHSNNGEFIKREKLSDTQWMEFSKFLDVNDGERLLYSTVGKYSITKQVKDGSIEGLRERKGYQMVTERFFKSKNDVLVMPDYGFFTLDTYRNGQLFPKYVLDFGNQSLPSKYIGEKYDDFSKTDAMKDYFKSVIEAKENNQWLYVLVVGPKQTYYNVFYNKETGKIYAGPCDQSLGLNIVDMDNDAIYGLIYLDFIEKKSPFYKYVEKFKATGFGNPLLVKMKINEK